MKKVILTVLLGLVATSASAQVFNPNQEGRRSFDVPIQPPEMREGYAYEGKGLHSAVPTGVPGPDCVVNPVSMRVAFTEVTQTKLVAGQVVEIPVNVLFGFDKDFVRVEGVDALTEFYTALVENNVEKIKIVGHTDSKGTEEYNQDLGFRRSAAVASALVAAGFNAGDIDIDSAGELEPKVANEFGDGRDDPNGRQINRRVDVNIVAVHEQEVEFVEVVDVDKNPQIFHVLGANNTVACTNNQPYIGIDVGGRLNTNGGVVIAVPR